VWLAAREGALRPLSEADEEVLERSMTDLHPLDISAATSVLLEAKQVLDELGVVFYLEEGTCLGAIREHGFIPHDDDVDIASVFGLHGVTEDLVDRIAAGFRERGFITKVICQSHAFYVPAVKGSIRLDWHGRRVVDGSTFHYPGVRIPARLFENLKEIDFIGEKFLVPDPPEEFLQFKYGPDWRTPKPDAYVEDVVRLIQEAPIPGVPGRLRQSLTRHLLPWRAARIRVLDRQGEPVAGAEVAIAGVGHWRTNRQGYVWLYVSRARFHAVVVRYDGHEEVLYEEKIRRGGTYVYRPDASSTVGRIDALTRE
jgi:hypothetical protein